MSDQAGRETTPKGWPEALLNARVVFWCCPDHVCAPHRVELRDGIAYCLTDGCGKSSAARETTPKDRSGAPNGGDANDRGDTGA